MAYYFGGGAGGALAVSTGIGIVGLMAFGAYAAYQIGQNRERSYQEDSRFFFKFGDSYRTGGGFENSHGFKGFEHGHFSYEDIKDDFSKAEQEKSSTGCGGRQGEEETSTGCGGKAEPNTGCAGCFGEKPEGQTSFETPEAEQQCTSTRCAGKADTDTYLTWHHETTNQAKRLSEGEIKKLKAAGYNIHDLKPHDKFDLFKDERGNIFVKSKKGNGPGDPLNININEV